MAGELMNPQNILVELDSYLHKNDYTSAREYLTKALKRADALGDNRARVLILNEQMGLYRKIGDRENALESVNRALSEIEVMGVAEQVGSATTYLNCATVYKAFGNPEIALTLYRRAQAIYEKALPSTDNRLGGLYNNMALALVDLKKFNEAFVLYEKAISIMLCNENGAPEAAITYLNKANALEAQMGLENACEEIDECLNKAEALLESHVNRDGNYAFVCEKCAPTFLYYGRFSYSEEIAERSRRIYEGS
ncbi:MAG: tetratricopeptide repeat protein [Clostridia bacterium]|nr:tetratricopeptide repeat protein [Clostridia bacterium]